MRNHKEENLSKLRLEPLEALEALTEDELRKVVGGSLRIVDTSVESVYDDEISFGPAFDMFGYVVTDSPPD